LRRTQGCGRDEARTIANESESGECSARTGAKAGTARVGASAGEVWLVACWPARRWWRLCCWPGRLRGRRRPVTTAGASPPGPRRARPSTPGWAPFGTRRGPRAFPPRPSTRH